MKIYGKIKRRHRAKIHRPPEPGILANTVLPMIQHFVRLRQDFLEAVTIPFDAWLLGHNRAAFQRRYHLMTPKSLWGHCTVLAGAGWDA